jgi:hypothetical protein
VDHLGLSVLFIYMEVVLQMFGGESGTINLLGHLGVVAVRISLLVVVLLYFRNGQRAYMYMRIAFGEGNEDLMTTMPENLTRSDQKV